MSMNLNFIHENWPNFKIQQESLFTMNIIERFQYKIKKVNYK
jgi:hypothetical protein